MRRKKKKIIIKERKEIKKRVGKEVAALLDLLEKSQHLALIVVTSVVIKNKGQFF